MAWILNLETATGICSVALAQKGQAVSVCETREERAHASRLTGLISDCLREAGLTFQQLDAIAVSIGPGSYTGLRIGLATAKGLCYALGKPLIAISTLEAMATGWFDSSDKSYQGLVCPMIDARRMEVYAAIFGTGMQQVMPPTAVVVESNSFDQWIDNQNITFIGDGMPKCMDILKSNPNAIFDPSAYASAKGMVQKSFQLFESKNFEVLEHVGPVYLKEFFSPVPGKPKF